MSRIGVVRSGVASILAPKLVFMELVVELDGKGYKSIEVSRLRTDTMHLIKNGFFQTVLEVIQLR